MEVTCNQENEHIMHPALTDFPYNREPCSDAVTENRGMCLGRLLHGGRLLEVVTELLVEVDGSRDADGQSRVRRLAGGSHRRLSFRHRSGRV